MKWYETITRHLTPRSTRLLGSALLLSMSMLMSACLIIDIQITSNVDAGGTVTVTIVVQEDTPDANAWRGVEILLVPSDWTFVSGTYEASDINGAVGNGSLVEEPAWVDSVAIGVYPAPEGMKWVALISDMAHAHGDTLLVESTVEFTAGSTGGTFPVGIVVTKESYGPSNGDWFGPNINGADSSMVNLVTVNAGVSILGDLLPVPDDVIATLNQAGAGLTSDVMNTLTDHLDRDTDYTIHAVVLTDPLKSGLATWNADRGGPDRVHIYIRDLAADTMGNTGMGIQLVDGAYEQNGTLDLIPGDVIEVTGRFTPFGNSVQMSPSTTIVVLGYYTDFGLSDNIIVPDTIPSTAYVTKGFGDGTYQANWDNYNELNGAYACIENATIFRRTVTGSREDWSVTTDGGETTLVTYDMSLRYRNDRRNAYVAPFDVRSDNFVPPPIGATVTLCGTVVHQGGNDPFGQSIPADGMLSIVPWNDSDLIVTASPPQVSAPNRPDVFLTSSDAFEVSSDVTFDPERTSAGVTLTFTTAEGSTDVAMANTEGTTWTGTIPAQAEGAFVWYSVTAEDNTGASTTSTTRTYRVLDADGINTIAEVQETADGMAGDSPFAGASGDMDITASVQSHPTVSGFITIQDDETLAPWSGVLLSSSEALVADLPNGQVIHITAGTVTENFGVTELSDITYEKVAGKSQDALPYKVLATDDVLDSAAPEAYEGMLVRFEDVLITAFENNFGEWRFSNGAPEDYIRGDGASTSFPDDNSAFTPGEVYSFIQGFWWYSFGTFKVIPEDPETDKGEVTNVAVEPIGVGVPGQFALNQNYPNPFNPTTTITYDVAAAGHVRIDVYDVTGRLVETLVNEQHSAGSYRATFDAASLPSGMYLYRMTAGNQVMMNKMLLLR